MVRFKTASKNGSVLVGNSDFGVRILNEVGAKTNDIVVFDNEDEFNEWSKAIYNEEGFTYFRYLTSTQGKMYIYIDDSAALNSARDIGATLNGKYYIYLQTEDINPVFAFVKKT